MTHKVCRLSLTRWLGCVCASYGLDAGRPLLPLNERGKGDLAGRQAGSAHKHSSAVSGVTQADNIYTNRHGFFLEPWQDPGAMVRWRSQLRSPKVHRWMGGPRTIKAWKEAKKKRKKGTLVKYQYHQWSRVETSDAFDPARTWRA